jgi:hypothetical protein
MPDQITELWDSIRYGIINAVVPIIDPKPEYIQDILCQLLRQDMQCWCVFDEDKNILGYIITSISVDINTGYRTLLIYSLFLYKSIDRTQWDSLYDAVEKFGKANKCSRMTAYSANPDAISIAEKLGFMKDYTYLIKDI